MNHRIARSRSGLVPSKAAIPAFAALRAFDACARLGSIRKAALVLSIDHTVVSRHIRALEAWLGVSLIERSRSGASLTNEGRRYHSVVAGAIDDLASATLGLVKDRESKHLLIWCVPGLAFHWLLPEIGSFEADHPDLMLEVRPTDQPPDFSRHEADVDIRYAAIYDPLPELPEIIRTVKLAEPGVVPVASPDYLSTMPPIKTASDLLDHQLLHEESFLNWHAWLAEQGVKEPLASSGPRFWHGHLTVDAAKRGRGIALVNRFFGGEALRDGQLVEIGDGLFEPVSLGSYNFYARADRWSANQLTTFRHWLIAAFGRTAALSPDKQR